ncbi:MAG: hypothetical protein HY293_17880 [Planctomycetes bacterium]|nr:hypothetical protein [Planctomycetota bacterium]
MNRRARWAGAMTQGSVWRRALKLGLTVGLLQAAIHQGDAWWRGDLRMTVIAKSILSPVVGFALVLVSAAATWVQEHRGGNDGD